MKTESPQAGKSPLLREDGRVVHELDPYDLRGFLDVAASYGTERFGYLATPNVDHFISLHESAEVRDLVAHAEFVLLDSRVAALVFRLLHGVRVPVCPGSDVTAALFEKVIAPTDRIVLLGCSPQQAQVLRQRFGLQQLLHHNPPMGFIHDPAAVEECLRFVEAASPFRFCFIGIGNPMGMSVARQLLERGRARGLGLAIGASVDFLTGKQKRAPVWVQHLGLEWLYRLLQEPRRLAWRYLVRGPKFFAYAGSCEIRLRPTLPRRNAGAGAGEAGQIAPHMGTPGHVIDPRQSGSG